MKAVVLVAGILATLMGIKLLETDRIGRGEFHAVLVFAVVGAMFLISSTDFITIFVGLETMSLSVLPARGLGQGLAASRTRRR